MKLNGIKHIFWDLDHTLWDFDSNSRDVLKDLFVSFELKDKGEIDNEFLDAKIATSSIYVSSILPKIDSLASIILHGDEDVLAMKHQWL